MLVESTYNSYGHLWNIEGLIHEYLVHSPFFMAFIVYYLCTGNGFYSLFKESGKCLDVFCLNR